MELPKSKKALIKMHKRPRSEDSALVTEVTIPKDPSVP
jgi:hypothetical protein